jgi:hypothetical protein
MAAISTDSQKERELTKSEIGQNLLVLSSHLQISDDTREPVTELQ